jgi:anti-sigma regulatory factor (Ser/Thr protein kinase)
MEMQPGTRPASSTDRDTGRGDAATLGASGDPPGARHAAIPPRFTRAFRGHPDQVAQARHFVARALSDCPAMVDAVLLTSELATNAVQHSASGAGGMFTVAISHAPGRVRLTVTDDGSAGHPMLAVADELATAGRGLMLVDGLALRWGYTGPGERGRGTGEKSTVWFELSCQ